MDPRLAVLDVPMNNAPSVSSKSTPCGKSEGGRGSIGSSTQPSVLKDLPQPSGRDAGLIYRIILFETACG